MRRQDVETGLIGGVILAVAGALLVVVSMCHPPQPSAAVIPTQTIESVVIVAATKIPLATPTSTVVLVPPIDHAATATATPTRTPMPTWTPTAPPTPTITPTQVLPVVLPRAGGEAP